MAENDFIDQEYEFDTYVSSQLAKIKAACLSGITPMLVGDPGVGKTAMIKEFARREGKELIIIIGSRLDPTDISGLPAPNTYKINDKNVRVTDQAIPWWQAKSLIKKDVVFFLDEFSNSPASVQASMLSFIQDREFGNGQGIPKETWIIGAMNPTDTAVDPYELAPPTTNRLFFLAWDHAKFINNWLNGMKVNFGNEFLNDNEKNWKTYVSEFLSTLSGSKYIHKLPETNMNVNPHIYGAITNIQQDIFTKAWPSMRSWDNATKIASQMPQNPDLIEEIFNGTVGYQASNAFFKYYREIGEWNILNNIDINELLDNPKIVDWKNVPLDTSHLYISAAFDEVKANKDKVLKMINLLKYISQKAKRNDLGAGIIKKVVDITPAKYIAEIKELVELYRG